MFLKNNVVCKCGTEHDRITEPFRVSTVGMKNMTTKITNGYHWDCPCGSTVFTEPETIDHKKCCCPDCMNEETPCRMDCERGEECRGCREAREQDGEEGYDVDRALGRR